VTDKTVPSSKPDPADSSGPVLQKGQIIGGYSLLNRIGRGGLGDVWRARKLQASYAPEVAIKVITSNAFEADEAGRRFGRELRILSELGHPDIAHLLDYGYTSDRRLFLVMELVRGQPLNEYCQSCSLRDRLRLFVRICRAVQYAHRRLIIHRDLKPENILVTESGDPKLLDFNAAKSLKGELDPELTQMGAPYTPRYASPEQIRAQELTTATDIYSLGVVLYELISGQSPYSEFTTSSYELSQAICESEPTSPSLNGNGDRYLDAIILHALTKEPDSRYASADALADDIEAWMDRRPISARPMTRLQRLGLLISRHRWASSLVISLSLLLTVATSVSIWQLQQARAERDVAQAVTGFLENLFQAADPGSTEFSGEDLFAILDERAETLLQNPPADSRISARLLAALGTLQANFGRPEPASELFEASFDARNDLEILVRWANARLEQGEQEGAAALFEQAHADRESMQPSMQAFHNASYAQLEVLRGNLSAALEMAEEAAMVAPAGSVDEVYAVDTLAQVLFHDGNLVRAAEVSHRALDLAIDFYGPLHLQVATSRNNLALILSRLDRDSEALILLEQATTDFVQLLGPDDPRLATSWSNLANRRSEQGFLSEAMEAHADALRLTRLHYGKDHPWVGLITGFQAQTLQRMGNLEDAQAHFDRALELLADEPGFHVRIALESAANQFLAGNLAQAQTTLDEARAVINETYPEGHARHLRLLELQTQMALADRSTEEVELGIEQLSAGGANADSIALLQIQQRIYQTDCIAAKHAWDQIDPANEMKKTALYRAAFHLLSSYCD